MRFTYALTPAGYQVTDAQGEFEFAPEVTELFAENICNGMNICHILNVIPALVAAK